MYFATLIYRGDVGKVDVIIQLTNVTRTDTVCCTKANR